MAGLDIPELVGIPAFQVTLELLAILELQDTAGPVSADTLDTQGLVDIQEFLVTRE